MASTVALAMTAASSSPAITGATAICDCSMACADMATLSAGAGLLSSLGAAGVGAVKRAAPKPSAAAATRAMEAPA
jgi:hypothetical protein